MPGRLLGSPDQSDEHLGCRWICSKSRVSSRERQSCDAGSLFGGIDCTFMNTQTCRFHVPRWPTIKIPQVETVIVTSSPRLIPTFKSPSAQRRAMKLSTGWFTGSLTIQTIRTCQEERSSCWVYTSLFDIQKSYTIQNIITYHFNFNPLLEHIPTPSSKLYRFWKSERNEQSTNGRAMSSLSFSRLAYYSGNDPVELPSSLDNSFWAPLGQTMYLDSQATITFFSRTCPHQTFAKTQLLSSWTKKIWTFVWSQNFSQSKALKTKLKAPAHATVVQTYSASAKTGPL